MTVPTPTSSLANAALPDEITPEIVRGAQAILERFHYTGGYAPSTIAAGALSHSLQYHLPKNDRPNQLVVARCVGTSTQSARTGHRLLAETLSDETIHHVLATTSR